MIGIALVLGVPLAILVALYLVSPQRWRKASVPADALPFRNKAFSALKRAALAWAWGILAMLLASAALAELPFPVPFSILGWSVPVVALLAAVWGTLRPRTYEDRVDRVRNGARIGWLLLVISLPFVYLPVCLFGSALARTGFGGLGLRRDEKPKAYHITAERYSTANFAFASPVSEKMPDGTIRWEPILEPAERPKKFLAYNYRYSNCGGYSFFYDVDGQILYANWSSN